MQLDFTEIPKANEGGGDQDTFEFFSRDFLENLGYEVLHHPDRGPDGKKDIIIKESRVGVSGTSYIKWLVSCKHFAHSGRSVSDNDEPNILDRVNAHDCDGFLGFYSTVPSSGLTANLKGLKGKIKTDCFDRERIENHLLSNPNGLKIASRYFPRSYGSYRIENPVPAKIFSETPKLTCEYCGKDLLKEPKSSIFVILKKIEYSKKRDVTFGRYEDAYLSCKGRCDNILKSKYFHDNDYIDEFSELWRYLHPTIFLQQLMYWFAILDIENERFGESAFKKLKKLFIGVFPQVSRELTTEERELIRGALDGGSFEFL